MMQGLKSDLQARDQDLLAVKTRLLQKESENTGKEHEVARLKKEVSA